MAAECPAAATSDGGVNRAITQVIMTMVIMVMIITRIIVEISETNKKDDQTKSRYLKGHLAAHVSHVTFFDQRDIPGSLSVMLLPS